MTGKVFNDTANIYQDQAKVLFDYYKSAAEKIVSEEITLETKIADLKKQIEEANTIISKQKSMLIVWIAATVISLLLILVLKPLGLLAIGTGYMIYRTIKTRKEAEKIVETCTEMLKKAEEDYLNIRRDYAVDKIGVAYVPVATRVPFENKSFIIDHTNSVDTKDFHLTVLHQPEEFKNSVLELENSMEKMPIIDGNTLPENINTSEYSLSVQNITLHDYAGNIDRQVRNISYLLNDSEDISVEIPVISPDSKEAEFINNHATSDTNGKPIIQAFDTSTEEMVSQFTNLHASKDQFAASDESDGGEYLKKLMSQLAESVQIMSKVKNAGASNLNNYAMSIFNLVLKSGYNQYSPILEAEEIERIRTSDFDYKTSVNEYTPFSMKKSSSVKFDLFTGNWVAEDGSRTAMPFGLHQVDEEVLMPVIETLMNENRIERLKIYNNIEDQKRTYLERWSAEVNNYFRDNRQAADELVNRMRETYADYCNAYNMYKSLSDTASMMKSTNNIENAEVFEQDAEAEMIAGFEEQAKNFNRQQEEFGDYMDRIMEDINNTTDGFAHIEYYEGSLRDSVSHDTAVAMSSVNTLTDRQKKLVSVSPYLASYAELPPEPKVSDEMMEHVCIDLQQQVKDSINRLNTENEENSFKIETVKLKEEPIIEETASSNEAASWEE